MEVTEHRPVYDAKKPAEVGNLSLIHLLIKILYKIENHKNMNIFFFQLIKVEHNYCIVPRVSPQRTNQINGLTSTINVTSGQSCIVSPTVSQIQPQTQYNVVNNNNKSK